MPGQVDERSEREYWLAARRRRLHFWTITVCVAAVVDLALTLDAHFSWRRSVNGPTVMPLGQLLGWASTVVLIALAGILITAWVRQNRVRPGGVRPGGVRPGGR